MKSFLLTLSALAAPILAFGQEISPVLFGQNYWLDDGDENRRGYLQLLWPQVEESGVSLVRIGGIAYNEGPPSLVRWTAMVDSIQAIGAEPLVQVPYTYSAEQAKALVEHFNQEGRKPVKYWSIGNEPMLHDEHTVEEVYEYLTRIAPALREADPEICILASDEAWLREEVYSAFCGGSLDLSGRNADGSWMIDGFTFHSYPNGPDFSREDVTLKSPASIRGNVERLLELMEAANAKHGREGDERLVWGLTEVNVTYANPDRDLEGYGNVSFLGGQFIAEVFGIGMRYGALTVAPWCINETDNVTTDFGYLGLPPDFSPRSSYYHMQMLSQTMRSSYMKSQSAYPLLKLVGSKDKNGFSVLLMNQEETQARSVSLGLSLDGSEVCVDAGIAKRFEVEVPAQSSVVLVFNRKGKAVKAIRYGLIDALRNLGPREERL